MELSPAAWTVVYLLYGLAFFCLGIVALILPRGSGNPSFPGNFWLLALFGLLHGTYEFLQAASIHFPWARALWLNATWQLLSYLPLVEFGRRALIMSRPGLRLDGAWLYPVLGGGLLLLVGIADDPLRGLANGGRYLVGGPGALLSGLAFLLMLHSPRQRALFAGGRRRHRTPLAALAFAFLGYALLTPLPGTLDPALPGWLPTHGDFLEATGMPVQMLRLLSAALAAVGLVALSRGLGSQRDDDLIRIVDSLNGFVYRCHNNRNWDLIHLEGSFEELAGYDRTSFLADGKGLGGLVFADDREHCWREVQQGLRRDGTFRIQYRLVCPDGTRRWVFERGEGVYTPRGQLQFLQGHVIDAHELVTTSEHLRARTEELEASRDEQLRLLDLARREQGRMAALLSAMSIGILFEDRDGRVEYVNPAFRRMWAIGDEAGLVGRPSHAVLEHSTHRFARPDHASRHVLHVLDTNEISERFEVDLYDGRILTQVSYPVRDPDERPLGRLWLYEDVTHERQTAQQLVYLAEHDALTGLYNRHHFQNHLERVIHSEHRRGGRFALLYLDLDDFKSINDTFGHRAGDTVLVRAAGEVAAVVRSQDIFARLGGDEFAILVDRESDQEPVELAERVGRAVSAIPFRFRGQNYRLTASIGIAHYPEHGDNVEDLVAHADTAMYQAKDLGKNTWAVFDSSRNTAEHMLERMSWSQRIGTALEHGHFELHFQGIYTVTDHRLHHLEALVRMRDPLDPDELSMPGQFIPVAEKTGQIRDIDRWVICESIARLARDASIAGIAINVSGRSFDEPGLPQYIAQQLEQRAVEPGRLVIELTETAAVSEMQDTQRFIEALQKTGCTVCLDDFGSGFSTFAYLKYLNVQILKIDGMFVRDLPNNTDNQAFIRAMVDVAQGLAKVTVAECVEDGPTLNMLADLGVDMAQGYYLHRPAPEIPQDSA